MELIKADLNHATLLAAMNRVLIQDEGSRNPMTLPELEERMSGWLRSGEYQAYLLVEEGQTAGYCLYKEYGDHIYIRQYVIAREMRKKGLGRLGMHLLRERVWGKGRLLRLDVLVNNTAGLDFWRSCGFQDYCLNMEMVNE